MRGARFAILTLPVALVLSVFCSTCSRKPDENLVPAGPMMADSIHFEYGVYLLPTPVPVKDPMGALHDALVGKYPDLKLVDEIPKGPKLMLLRAHIQKNARKEYAPPEMKSLQYFGRGISQEQAIALQKSDEVLILDFGHPKEQVWTALRMANALVEEIARRTGGLVWDEETREVFSPDAWHQRRLASWATSVPDVSSQTVIHSYPNGEYVRAITLGMAKLGLPDVVIEDSSWGSNDQVGNLINLLCQSIAEGGAIRKIGEFKLDLRAIKDSTVRDSQVKSLKANAAGVACLTLKQDKWEEGDPKNRLIELAPDKYPGDDLHARLDAMMSSFFGSEDALAKVRHNEELLAASARAKAKLPELQKAFTAGLQPGEFIDLKAPFPTPDGGTEWMWVEVTSWKDDKIKGLLDNEPSFTSDLHAGQVVEVRQEDIFDYIRHYPDKRTEGNTTGDIIRKKENDQSPTQPAKQIVPACDAD
jgi:uncharacterized protein YegJ (DUF2314 family)